MREGGKEGTKKGMKEEREGGRRRGREREREGGKRKERMNKVPDRDVSLSRRRNGKE